MERESDLEILKSLSRVSGFLNVLFLSDIATANGKFLEQHVVMRGDYVKRSKYDFPKEDPTEANWNTWISFWKSHLLDNYELPTPLGAWKCATHREWEWRYGPETKSLYRIQGSTFLTYTTDVGRPYNFSAGLTVTTFQPLGKPGFIDP